MANVATNILNQVVTQLQAVTGTGQYTFDLSASGVVQRGVPKTMGVHGVQVWVSSPRSESARGPVLTKFTRRLGVRIFGVAATAFGDSFSTREDAALDLEDDILRALEADRSLNGLVLDIIAMGAERVEGGKLADRYDLAVDDVETLDGLPVVVVELVAEYYASTGV
jgi:hypothetical protein